MGSFVHQIPYGVHLYFYIRLVFIHRILQMTKYPGCIFLPWNHFLSPIVI